MGEEKIDNAVKTARENYVGGWGVGYAKMGRIANELSTKQTTGRQWYYYTEEPMIISSDVFETQSVWITKKPPKK